MVRKSEWVPFIVTSLVVVALIIWLAGCGDGSSPTGGGEIDTDPPGVSSVTPLDQFHIEVVFDEAVDEATSQYRHNYEIYRQTLLLASPEAAHVPAAYGDTLDIEAAALMLDGQTVHLTVEPPTQDTETYRIVIKNIKDRHGNAMTAPGSQVFTGSSADDVTPPAILSRSPVPGATGVGIVQSVAVTFSEPMNWDSVRNAFSWTGPGGSIAFEMHNQENIYSFTPLQPLANGAQYTAAFASNTAADWSNNYLAATSWSFTTTNVLDTTPPTIVSTSPVHGATGVPLDVTLQINFSEAIDPNSMEQGGVMMTPNPGEGVPSWTNGGRTLHFDPHNPLQPNTTYTVIAVQGGVRDLAGNGLAETYSLTFSTGFTLPAGQFSGTISGDPASTQAADPAGTLVAASLVDMFGFMDDGPPPLAGTAVADQNGDYTIDYLQDDVYYPFALLDSNDDGELNPDYGDAIGFYGIDFTTIFTEEDIDSVIINGGNSETGVDFALYDPIAISGTVVYNGSLYAGSLHQYTCYVGVFDASTFDTTGGLPEPDYGDETNLSSYPEYSFHEFDGIQEGTYYVGSYLDVNHNHEFDGESEPFNFYSVGGSWATVTVENGEDALDVDIYLEDPGAVPAPPMSSPVTWGSADDTAGGATTLQRLLRAAANAARQQHPAR